MTAARCRWLGLLILGALAACRPAPAEVTLPPQPLPISAPASAAGGAPLTVALGPADLPDGAPATLLLVGSYGPQTVATTFANGRAQVTLTPELTSQAGHVTLIAVAPGYQGRAALTLRADRPVEPITPLVGARSITADGAHWSMVVVVPFDRFGNPVEDGLPVTVRALHPGDRLEVITRPVAHLLAWVRLYSGVLAGRSVIGVDAAGVPGPEGVLLEVPGPPVPFGLQAEPVSLPADGRSLLTLRTDVLRDAFGNVLLDGAQVTFMVEDAEGLRRWLPAYTLDGSAETPLQAPDRPGPVTVTALAFGVVSRPLNLTFAPDVQAFGLATRFPPGAILIEAGPILSTLGQYAPDGLLVRFDLTGPAGLQLSQTALLDGGYAHAVWRRADLPSGSYQVEAAAGAGRGTLAFDLPAEDAP